ncbi:MAG: HAD hydrolase-like protein [Candidatus Moraniibacteriota bacterium]|nr:MAG: HAD hydrolase-like protein [Candidatus Moranbacteria bacterium]
MNKKIFLDFDDVLFYTGEFIKDFQEIFFLQGISKEVFMETYKRVKERQCKTIGYDYEEHLLELKKIISFDEKKLRNAVEVFIHHCSRYIFSDVIPFLTFFQEKKYQLFLVSLGISDFQKNKIKGSGIESFFRSILVGDIHKGYEIKSFLKEEKDSAWFLDDRPEHIKNVKITNPFIKTIFVTRVEGRYKEKITEYCDFEVKDLEEAKKILMR